MKVRQILTGFILLIVVASIYRIMPDRPYGFAPQIAMAVFAGAIIKNKKFAFLLPLLSMFISDALYEVIYRAGAGSMPGFYEGQITNYILFTSLTCFGFFIKHFNVRRIALASVAAPTTYFLISNFLVWMSSSPSAGLNRPKTFDGLLLSYADGLPFYPWSVAATVIFSAVLFGSYFLLVKNYLQPANEALSERFTTLH